MGFSLRNMKRTTSSNSSMTAASTTTSTQTSPLSSRSNSTDSAPSDLILTQAPTVQITKTNTAKSSLSKTSSSSSFLSLSRFRSQDPAKYAPKKYKFRVADPKYVAVLGAWDMNFGASDDRRGSVTSGISPCASRRNSICYAEHIEAA